MSVKTPVLPYSTSAMNELSNLLGHSPPFCHPTQKTRGSIQSVALSPLRKIILASQVQGFERFSNASDSLFGGRTSFTCLEMLTLADFWSQELRWETQTKSSQRPCVSDANRRLLSLCCTPRLSSPGLALLAFVTLTTC